MKYLIAAAALFVASPSLAAITTIDFNDYTVNPALNYTGNAVIQAGSNSVGAAGPGNSTPYYSTTGTSQINFVDQKNGINWISFDWYSNDKYNEVFFLDSKKHVIAAVHGWGSGNQTNTADNGNFKYIFTAKQKKHGFSGIKFVSRDNKSNPQAAFEVDNVVSNVPEPASWALMLVGFGLTGAAIRGRRYGVVAA